MKPTIAIDALTHAGLSTAAATLWAERVQQALSQSSTPEAAWQVLSAELIAENCEFAVHHAIFMWLFPSWHETPFSVPVCQPTQHDKQHANIVSFMHETHCQDVASLHQWTREHADAFWQKMIKTLGIVFKRPAEQICDLTQGVTSPVWLPQAAMNIADSCFTANPKATALIYENQQHELVSMSYSELNDLSNQIANSLVERGMQKGDTIAIAMPMNPVAVASFLGIIKMGGAVVSIADSFSADEIAVRLRIANTKAVITQDFCNWGTKLLPLYEKMIHANAPACIVVSYQAPASVTLRSGDIAYENFLSSNKQFSSVACKPMDACNILFSSGTTADPKAIPWLHVTPIKGASDAYFHQNIKPGDVLTWPTSLGWMMGPWLVFAALINHAAIALFTGAPKGREFGEFVARAKVTMLGVVPTLVAAWRQSRCMEGLDWSHLKVFSSTGECSNPEDMFYLMWLAKYKPIIEYCGGTEIGGAYISSTVIENNYPSLFTTPTMGSDFTILNEQGVPSELGEVAIIPPALGLSVSLLNADHTKVYYTGMPRWHNVTLRRHGDQICRYPNQTYSILGRVDDTMNLGGIKVSAAEIERAIADLEPVRESAAIAIKPADNGPSQLVIYAAVTNKPSDKQEILKRMQQRINQHLNPLFKIHDVVFVADLPKTASNKIMRRVLRKEYSEAK